MSCVARKLSGATSSVNASPLILSDFYRWVLNRTDLNGIAQEMMIKEGVCLVGSVCESVTRDAMHTICIRWKIQNAQSSAPGFRLEMDVEGVAEGAERKDVDIVISEFVFAQLPIVQKEQVFTVAMVQRLVNQRREVIAVHALAEPGKFTTDPTPVHSPYRRAVQESLDHLLDRARLIGVHTGSWAESMVQQRGPISTRDLHGLLALAQKHPVKELEQTAQKALHHGTWSGPARLNSRLHLIVNRITIPPVMPLIFTIIGFRLLAGPPKPSISHRSAR